MGRRVARPGRGSVWGRAAGGAAGHPSERAAATAARQHLCGAAASCRLRSPRAAAPRSPGPSSHLWRRPSRLTLSHPHLPRRKRKPFPSPPVPAPPDGQLLAAVPPLVPAPDPAAHPPQQRHRLGRRLPARRQGLGRARHDGARDHDGMGATARVLGRAPGAAGAGFRCACSDERRLRAGNAIKWQQRPPPRPAPPRSAASRAPARSAASPSNAARPGSGPPRKPRPANPSPHPPPSPQSACATTRKYCSGGRSGVGSTRRVGPTTLAQCANIALGSCQQARARAPRAL